MKRKKCSHVVVVFYFILVQSKFALNISLPFFFDLLTMHSSQTIQSNEKRKSRLYNYMNLFDLEDKNR